VLLEQATSDTGTAQPAWQPSYAHLAPVAGAPEESGRNRSDVGVDERRRTAVGLDFDQFRTPRTPVHLATAALDADHQAMSMALPHRPLP
jgi:hypothetical protein